MRSFGECSFLEDSRYASQIIFVASKAWSRVPGAAQRECNEWCAADTDLGFTRDLRSNARKSGKPDLRGPLRSEALAVPDQRCTNS